MEATPLSPDKVRRNAKKARKFTIAQKASLRKRVSPRMCSGNWEDHCVDQLLAGRASVVTDSRPPAERRGRIDPLLTELETRGIYPPPADHPTDAMRNCQSRACRLRMYPAPYVRVHAYIARDPQGMPVILVKRRCVDCLEAVRERQDRQFEKECEEAGIARGPDNSQALSIDEIVVKNMDPNEPKMLAHESEAALRRYIARYMERLNARGPVKLIV